MPTEHIKVYEEKKRLSVWLWIVPLLAVLAFAVFFVKHHRIQSVTPAAGSALPSLGSVHYETASPELNPDGLATIDRAAETLRGNPNVGLRLEGYPKTDDALSRQRAESVARALESRGIDRTRLTVAPFPPPTPADTDPIPDQAPDTRRIQLFLRDKTH